MQTALDLLMLADMYQIADLLRSLEDVLCSVINNNTVLSILFYAETHNTDTLRERCLNFVNKHLVSILCSEAILQLPHKHLCQLLSRDNLRIDEVEIFHAVQRFIAYNKPNPDKRSELLKCIRLSEIPADLLGQKVAASGLFPRTEVTFAMISQGGMYSGEDAMPRGRLGECVLEFSAFWCY